MTVPSAEAAADALAAALNTAGIGSGIPGLKYARNRYPKYALKELEQPKADVIVHWPQRMDPHDDGGTATETQLAVLIQRQCEKTDVARVDELTALLEGIAWFLARSDIRGLGYPIEPLLVTRDDDLLDKAHFVGGIVVVYRVYRDGEDDE